MCRLVVVLQHKTFIYDLNSTTILEEIETVPNTKGKIPTAVRLPNISDYMSSWTMEKSLSSVDSFYISYLPLMHASKSGLCAFAPNPEACYLAIPASTSKGSALVYRASEPELICQVL
jgi:autophagy-related protein 18